MSHSTTHIQYKIAEYADEMEQIYQLNYETFVEEIPQHQTNSERKLIDRFNHENTYIIAKKEDEVIGMISVNGKRPFSLDQKLDNLDTYLPEQALPCEVRLLSIKTRYRGGRIFYGMCEKLVSYCLEQGYNMALISGTVRQRKLYKHIGFQAFGPLVGTEKAPYQPMFLTKKNFELSSKVFQRLMQREEKRFYHNFLPGPVEIPEAVKKAWQEPPISHRSSKFRETVKNVQHQLCNLTNANYAEIVVGTGTLANDMVAAQLSVHFGRGLILANGEFGERLIDHGNRWGLSFEKIYKQWNTSITIEEIESVLAENPDIKWLWTVHCDTSTGYVFPLDDLQAVCNKHNVHLCVDACSTVGVFPVDLKGVYLASTVSGKGLASYPGIAIVFHRKEILPNERIPNYLDIGRYQAYESVPYTHSFNGLLALEAALSNPQPTIKELADKICHEFNSVGMTVLRGDGYSPGIITASLSNGMSSRDFGDHLKSFGVHVSYESGYLLRRNWFQIALMGEQKYESVMKAIDIIKNQYKQYLEEKGTEDEKNSGLFI
ncbi:aminotransferase class V-fold PLP-dependent enzyme [Virgibacillus oceani]|uniref:Acetyltransferase n=1 Tax=Virgibacillus oceani TaxID=1479511 RepID=A0A917HLW3_9BACI|nr:aminotransferase class V-fold PLP-dependent enzyme [Virgibacillus oceani]GGG83408.1 acetyltransferase [Virgibacillus oceani]